MNPTRLKILFGAAAVLFVLLVWSWISNWGKVTVRADGMPLSQVIQTIERQGGIKLLTNGDPATPIILNVQKVPVVEAVDALAASVDGDWSVRYAAAPTKPEVGNILTSLGQGGRRDSDYETFGGRGGWGGGGFDMAPAAIDSRRVEWKVSPSENKTLQSYLNQLAIKTGVSITVPRSWNPAVAKDPKGGSASASVSELVKSVGGQMEEVFFLRIQDRDRDFADNRGEGRDRPRGQDGGFARPDFNPEWIEERAQARIDQLPADKREEARKDLAEARDFFGKMRDFPEDQRRAAFEQFFNNPAVQEKMLERMMTRDARRSPEKRAERFRDYISRKKEAKTQAQANP